MKRFGLIVMFTLAAAMPAGATGYDLTVHVPATMPGVGTALPWVVVRHDTTGGPYTSQLTLPLGTSVAGLHRTPSSGDWLFSVAVPTTIGGTFWLPQDVVRYNSSAGTFTCYFRGSALGIPLSSQIDALFLEGGDAGSLVLSFNVPTTIGGQTYQRADLVRFNPTGTACTGWNFAGAYFTTPPPIPVSANVVAADVVGTSTILSFDTPTTLGSTTYFPGDLVSWTGSGFVLFYRDPAWPVGTRINDVAFLPTSTAASPAATVVRAPALSGLGALCLILAVCAAGWLMTRRIAT